LFPHEQNKWNRRLESGHRRFETQSLEIKWVKLGPNQEQLKEALICNENIGMYGYQHHNGHKLIPSRGVDHFPTMTESEVESRFFLYRPYGGLLDKLYR
jgi:hypothetical protein